MPALKCPRCATVINAAPGSSPRCPNCGFTGNAPAMPMAPAAPAYAAPPQTRHDSPFSAPPAPPHRDLPRPGWVLMVAVFQFIGAGFAILFGLLAVTVGGFIGQAIEEEADGEPWADLVAGIIAVVGIVAILWGAFQIVLGTQNLKGRNWARIVTLVLSFLSGFGNLATLFIGNVLALFSLVFDVLIIVGLLLPVTAAWFRQETDRRAGRLPAAPPPTY